MDDLRVAFRRLRTSPGRTIAATLTLALAVGANVAVFSVADAVLFRPLPYRDPGRLYLLQTVTPERASFTVAVDAVQAINEHHRGLSDVAARGPAAIVTHTAGGEAEYVAATSVASNYFEILGVQPGLGRLFTSADLSDPGAKAVLSHDTWQSRFGGDTTIIGRVVPLGSRAREVIGVLPRGFMFPAEFIVFLYGLSGAPEYITLSPYPDTSTMRRPVVNPVVRLEPGMTVEQAQAELDAIIGALPSSGAAKRRIVLQDIRSVLFPTVGPVMTLLVAAAGLVLLLGAINLSTLFLTAVRRRETEIGVHVALGASRARIVRPILIEAVAIGVVAAVLAVAGAALTFDMLARQVPPIAYGAARIGVDLRVAAFALLLGVAGGLLFALLPAWRLSRMDAMALLGRRERRARRRYAEPGLIAAQVAMALVLTFGAAIAGRALVSILRTPLGFDPEHVLTIEVRPPANDAATKRDFYRRALGALHAHGDVFAAGAGSSVPLDSSGPDDVVKVGNDTAAAVVRATPDYFETLGISVVRGRLFSPTDADAAGDLAVVSESAAGVLFPDDDPIGKSFTTLRGWHLTVVGIVRDVRHGSSDFPWRPAVYGMANDMPRDMKLVARVRPGPTVAADLRREIGSIAPGQPVVVRSLSKMIGDLPQYRNRRFQTLVLGGFAALALVLTALGTFAAIAFLVAARRREIAIRMAIGASSPRVIRLFVGRGLSAVTLGIMAGSLAAWWLGRIAESRLFEVTGRDPLALAVSVVAVMTAGAMAAYLPARRAARVDPASVLRAE